MFILSLGILKDNKNIFTSETTYLGQLMLNLHLISTI